MYDTSKNVLDRQVLIFRTILNCLRNICKGLPGKPQDNMWDTNSPLEMLMETRRNTDGCVYLMLYGGILELLSMYSVII